MFLVLSAALALAGCDDGGGGPKDLGRFFDPAPAYSASQCKGVDDKLAGRREIRLFTYGLTDVEGTTRGLARYYQRHGLTFFTQAEPSSVQMGYALDTDNNALTIALIKAFPNVDFSQEEKIKSDPVLWQQILDFTVNFLLGPMIEFAEREGRVGVGVTNLVVIPQIERPGGMKLTQPGQEIAGMAISPALLAVFSQQQTQEGQIWKGVKLPADFTPMMFLGHDVLRRVAATHSDLRDLVVAHEFGHTNALVHRETARNLMFPGVTPGQNSCGDSLAEDQIATMRGTLGLAGAGQALLAGARDAGHEGAPAPPFTPKDLKALMGGDAQAMRRLLAPLLHAP